MTDKDRRTLMQSYRKLFKIENSFFPYPDSYIKVIKQQCYSNYRLGLTAQSKTADLHFLEWLKKLQYP